MISTLTYESPVCTLHRCFSTPYQTPCCEMQDFFWVFAQPAHGILPGIVDLDLNCSGVSVQALLPRSVLHSAIGRILSYQPFQLSARGTSHAWVLFLPWLFFQLSSFHYVTHSLSSLSFGATFLMYSWSSEISSWIVALMLTRPLPPSVIQIKKYKSVYKSFLNNRLHKNLSKYSIKEQKTTSKDMELKQ